MKKVKVLNAYLQKGYAMMPFENEAYRKFFELLLRNDGGIYFHCSAGKDRAGICAALFMLALGVGERNVMREYMLSNAYLKEVNRQFYALHKIPLHLRRSLAPLMKVSGKSIRLSLREIKKRYPDFNAYLEAEYGLDEAIKEFLRSEYCHG